MANESVPVFGAAVVDSSLLNWCFSPAARVSWTCLRMDGICGRRCSVRLAIAYPGSSGELPRPHCEEAIVPLGEELQIALDSHCGLTFRGSGQSRSLDGGRASSVSGDGEFSLTFRWDCKRSRYWSRHTALYKTVSPLDIAKVYFR